MYIVEADKQQLVFATIPSNQRISLVNQGTQSVWYRLLLTHPDNYQLSRQCGTLEFGEHASILIQIRSYDSICAFNYFKNKLVIVYGPMEDKNLQNTQNSDLCCLNLVNINSLECSIRVDINLIKPIREDSLRILKKTLKLHKYSVKSGIDQYNDYILKYFKQYGTIIGIEHFNSFIRIDYLEPITIEPKILIDRNKQVVVGVSYLCNYTGKQKTISMIIPKKLKQMTKIETHINVRQVFSYENIVVCRTDTKLYIYKQTTGECQSVQYQDFRIGLYRPYLCAVMQYKYIIFYQNFDELKTIKIKFKKLIVKCFAKFGNTLYVAGINCSKVPMKVSTTRRQIYCVENFDTNKLIVTPTQTISIPKSENQIEYIQIQNPHLIAYCKPNLYLINLQTRQIILKLEKEIIYLQLLEGRYASSVMNCIAITNQNHICKINFDRFGTIFGVEVNETKQQAKSVCQTKDGRVFLAVRNKIYDYHPQKDKILNEFEMDQKSEVLLIKTNHKGQLILYKKCDESHYFIEINQFV